jgi:hypothetical protein
MSLCEAKHAENRRRKFMESVIHLASFRIQSRAVISPLLNPPALERFGFHGM